MSGPTWRPWLSGASPLLLALALFAVAPVSDLAADALQAGVVTGRTLEAESGEPIVGAEVVLRDLRGTVVRSSRSGPDGRFRLDDLAPGRYALQATRLGYAAAARTNVEVTAAALIEVDLAMSRQALRISGLVVTAARRVERLVDTDVPTVTLDGDRVRESANPTVFGALGSVSGVDLFEAGLGHQQVSARGFVNPFSTNLLVLVDHRLAALPGLGTLLPGMVTAAQDDLDRIEVVRGPASALYGPNAANGVVNLVTRGPLRDPGHSISVTGGERDHLRVAGRSAGRLSDRWAYVLSVEDRRVRDFPVYNTFDGSEGFTIRDSPDFDIHHRTLSGSVHLEARPGARLIYSAGASRADYVNLTVVSRLQVDGWTTRYHQLRGHFDDVIGGGTLFVQGYWTGNDAGDSHYLDIAARSRIPTEYGGRGLDSIQAREAARFVDRSDRIDLELQHAVELSGGHRLTVGLQWRRTRPDSDGTYLADGPDDAAIRFDEAGAYASLEGQLGSDLRLNVVGRFDHHDDVGSRFSPKLGLVWNPVGSHTLRGSYNRAFNSPVTFLLHARSFVGFGPTGAPIMVRGNRDGIRFVNVSGGPVPDPISPLEPLSVSSIELGYRGVIGSRFSIDLSLFRSVYWNYISKEVTLSRPADGVFTVDPTTGEPRMEITRSYLNYGELPVLGMDLGLEWHLGGGWRWSGSWSEQSPGRFRRPVEGLDPPS
ncbi:MAG TPA: TonB-dependent receptor, partial [Longimicrobiales bacterium]|nr:TonB-dependent receptor [Longimicrobiales bacterium]